jgi:hypothetical protein
MQFDGQGKVFVTERAIVDITGDDAFLRSGEGETGFDQRPFGCGNVFHQEIEIAIRTKGRKRVVGGDLGAFEHHYGTVHDGANTLQEPWAGDRRVRAPFRVPVQIIRDIPPRFL